MCGSRGGGGGVVGGGGQEVRIPPEKSHNIGFPSSIGPDSLKITKLPSQRSNGVSLSGQ